MSTGELKDDYMFYYFLYAIWAGFSQVTTRAAFQTEKHAKIFLGAIFLLYIGLIFATPFTSDTVRYLQYLNSISTESLFGAISGVRWEPGFVVYQWLISVFTTSPIIFIGLTISIMWVMLVTALRKVAVWHFIPLIMFGYFSFFIYFNITTNIIRQGFTVHLLLFMIIYLWKNDYKKAIVFFLAAVTFHTSALIAGVLFVIKKFNIQLKYIIAVTALSALVMVTGLNTLFLEFAGSFLGGGIGDRLLRYSSEAILERYDGEINRLDFLVFTLAWAGWGLWFLSRHLKDDLFYHWLVKSYLMLSSIFMVLGFIAYSDRIALYAWFLIPLLLFYPVTKMPGPEKNKYVIGGIIICAGMFFVFEVWEYFQRLWFII
ncbi:EpsG family protein [Alkalicoccus halolimnae]|uniref:EpsG family protein n=1 Tax=Alkalicoccus halolimnae TaxID=1667239 RepID=A0A5C7F8F3_9BACI|nr:EpsG family protein [Alkalicoccus halolimnae]TXF86991.1 EpsG family protein [Alkalicoccus halolimnae]